jgi:hypothetical protein
MSNQILIYSYAAKWWGNYGTQAPTLQKMVVRVLYLTSSASGCERNWSCYEGVSLQLSIQKAVPKSEQLILYFHVVSTMNLIFLLQIHTKKRNKLTCERLEQLVFVRFNNLHADKKKKVQKNKNIDPLLATEASHAQGWMLEAEDEASDVEPVTGLTWKLIAETCGAADVTRLRRSARLNQRRDIEDDVHSEPEEEEKIDDEEIDYESDQQDVVTTGYDQEEEWMNDD